MKYYSDVTQKVYDTEEELNKAEEEIKTLEEEKEKKSALVSKEKKELANKIDVAEDTLNAAYKDLDLAREKAKDVQREALKQIENILRPAEEAVKNAQAERLDAIREFNQKYGVFTTTLTGQKAADEMSRVWRSFDKLFSDFFF